MKYYSFSLKVDIEVIVPASNQEEAAKKLSNKIDCDDIAEVMSENIEVDYDYPIESDENEYLHPDIWQAVLK